MPNLLKKPANWSSLAAGIEVNPSGSGLRLKQGIIDDFNDASLDPAFTAYSGAGGSVVEAGGKLSLISGAAAQFAMIEYDAGLNLTRENYMKIEFAVNASSTSLLALMNPGNSFPTTGSGTSTGEWLQIFNVGTTLFMQGLTGGGGAVGQVTTTIVLGTTYVIELWVTSTQLVYQLWNAAQTVMLDCGFVDLTATQKSSDAPQVAFGDSKSDSRTCNIEIFDLIIEDGIFSSLSPVSTMGVVALPVGFVVNGLGDWLTNLDGTASLQTAYNINNAGWSAAFASPAAMEAFLNANPITITDAINSVDTRAFHNSNGSEQSEFFVSEGPDLTGGAAACDFPAVGTVTKDVIFDNGNLVGTNERAPESKVDNGFQYGEDGTELTGTAKRISLPLKVIKLPGIEVIKI
jgi:hypothetical protein